MNEKSGERLTEKPRILEAPYNLDAQAEVLDAHLKVATGLWGYAATVSKPCPPKVGLIERFVRWLLAERELSPPLDPIDIQMQINYEVWSGLRCWRCGERYDGFLDCVCSRAHLPARRQP